MLCARVRVPNGYRVLGIDTGAGHDGFADKFRRVRAATLMGRLLIDRIVEHDGANGIPWDGYLSRITVPQYVARFRDRLPPKLAGREFLRLFGELDDSTIRVEPDVVYRIRSRTEHHIYEHQRTLSFVEAVSRLAAGENDACQVVGELMAASHWSYGQRCGLGSREADLLVRLLRARGASAGICGAKVSGRGCGGTVTVWMKDDPTAESALHGTLDEYRQQTGFTPRLLHPGARGGYAATVQRV